MDIPRGCDADLAAHRDEHHRVPDDHEQDDHLIVPGVADEPFVQSIQRTHSQQESKHQRREHRQNQPEASLGEKLVQVQVKARCAGQGDSDRNHPENAGGQNPIAQVVDALYFGDDLRRRQIGHLREHDQAQEAGANSDQTDLYKNVPHKLRESGQIWQASRAQKQPDGKDQAGHDQDGRDKKPTTNSLHSSNLRRASTLQ